MSLQNKNVLVQVDDLFYEGKVVFHNQKTDVVVVLPQWISQGPPTKTNPQKEYKAEFLITASPDDVVLSPGEDD